MLRLLIYTVIAAIAPSLVPGVRTESLSSAIGVALLFGLFNFFLGFLLKLFIGFLTLPLTLVTIGLFLLLIPTLVNMVLLRLVASMLSGFSISGWWPAFVLGLLFSAGQYLTEHAFQPD